jgi:hypothetical protein
MKHIESKLNTSRLNSKLAYTLTDIHGDLWHFHPDRLNLLTPIAHEVLITMEQADGPYEPVGSAVSEREALELITSDYRRRKPENDDLCPEQYALWSRSPNGTYRRDATLTKASPS